MRMTKPSSDTLCGLFFIAIAIGFGWAATGYDIGTPRRMGPGFFPLLAAAALGGLGLLIVLRDRLATARAKSPPAPERSVAWGPGLRVLAGVLFFGATASGLGLVPSLAVTVLAASRAGHNSWRQSVVQCLVLTVLCTVIFQMGLGLKLPLVGPWIGGATLGRA